MSPEVNDTNQMLALTDEGMSHSLANCIIICERLDQSQAIREAHSVLSSKPRSLPGG